MKYAIISDIHGNSNAFDLVIDDIKKNGCEMILALGDYILAGYDPNYALSKLINLKNQMYFYKEKIKK